MMRTGFRKLCFSSYSLQHKTSRTTERDAPGNESVTTQLGSEATSALCNKKSQPAAVVTRRVQQEATTHCGREFEYHIF